AISSQAMSSDIPVRIVAPATTPRTHEPVPASPVVAPVMPQLIEPDVPAASPILHEAVSGAPSGPAGYLPREADAPMREAPHTLQRMPSTVPQPAMPLPMESNRIRPDADWRSLTTADHAMDALLP